MSRWLNRPFAGTLRPHGFRGPAQVYGIDVLRFAAAALVVCYHLTFTIWADPRPGIEPRSVEALKPIGLLLNSGWVGVEIFFVISGYVIAFTANGRTPIGFINSRLLRLVPGVMICATLTLPALYFYYHEPLPQIVKEYAGSLLFLPLGPWVAGPYWTLPVEVFFYASVLGLLLVDRFRWIDGLSWALVMISAILWSLVFWLPARVHGAAAVHWLATHRPGELALLHHGAFFAMGMLAWLVHAKRATPGRCLCLLIAVIPCLAEIVAQARETALYMHAPVSAVIASLVWMIAMVAILCSLAFNERITAVLGNAQPAMRLMGRCTFPLYLLHEPSGIMMVHWALLHHWSVKVSLAVPFLLLVGAAIVVAQILEPLVRTFCQMTLTRIEARLPVWTAWIKRPTEMI